MPFSSTWVENGVSSKFCVTMQLHKQKEVFILLTKELGVERVKQSDIFLKICLD
jgi:hypothetical protein